MAIVAPGIVKNVEHAVFVVVVEQRRGGEQEQGAREDRAIDVRVLV